MHTIAASRNVYRSVARRCVCCGTSSGEGSSTRYLPTRSWANSRSYGVPAYAEKEIEHEPEVYSSRAVESDRHGGFVSVGSYNDERTASDFIGKPPNVSQPVESLQTSPDGIKIVDDGPIDQSPKPTPVDNSDQLVSTSPKLDRPKKEKDKQSKTKRQLSAKAKRTQSRLALAERLRQAPFLFVPPLSEPLEKVLEITDMQPGQSEVDISVTPLTSSSSPPPQPPPNPDSPPDLSALLRFQPKNKAPNRFHPKYADRYNHLYRRISNAFVHKQVVKLGNELLRTRKLEEEMMNAPFDVGGSTNVELPMMEKGKPPVVASSKIKKLQWKTSKNNAIKVILADWGWPSPEEVERERKRMELLDAPTEGTVELSNAEAYMISRDPQGWQRIVRTSGAQLSIIHEPKLAIRINARMEDMVRCRELIQQKQKDILQADFSVANYGGVRKELLRVISNATNTYVEAISDDMVRIHHLTSQQKTSAERLFKYAHANIETHPRNAHLAVLTSPMDALTRQTSKVIPTEFALYPIVPASHQIHEGRGIGSHWFLAGRSLFRLRRLGGWLGKIKWEKQSEEETLDEGHVDVVRPLDGAQAGRLSELLLDPTLTLPPQIEVQDVQRSVAAEVGHVLHTTLSTQDGQPRSSLLPPVTKSHKLSHFNNWVRTEDQLPIFMPTPATPESVKVLRGCGSQAFRKLRYRHSAVENAVETAPKSGTERYLSFYCKLPDVGEKGATQTPSDMLVAPEGMGSVVDMAAVETAVEADPSAITAFVSEERCIHVQIPDSANDVRLTQVVQGRLAYDAIHSKLLTYFAVIQGDNLRIREPQPPRRMPATLKQDKHYDLASIEDVELYSVVDEKGVTHHFERSVTMSALPLTNTETYHKMEVAEADVHSLLRACRNALP